MKNAVTHLYFLCIAAWLSLLLLPRVYAASPPMDRIRSVTYFPFPLSWTDTNTVNGFLNDLPKIQSQGFNCVWFVIAWFDFEPVALPSTAASYNQNAFNNLKQVISALEQRGMCAILPIDYLGVGWSPQGIKADRWLFDTDSYNAFSTYTARLANELKPYTNVIYLLFNESTFPQGDAVHDPDIEQQMRNYLFSINSDLSHWNAIWNKQYASWNDVKLADVVWTRPYIEWMDYYARSRLSALPQVLRVNGNAQIKIGYHFYFAGTDKLYANGLYSWNGNGPFDFLSSGIYPNKGMSDDPQFYINFSNALYNFLKTLEPNKPVFLGEIGMSTYDWPNNSDISRIIQPILHSVTEKKVGFNVWMWKDFPVTIPKTNNQAQFGITDADGNEKPMISAIKPFLSPGLPGDIDGNGKVDIFDYNLLVTDFGKTGNPGFTHADLDNNGKVDIFDYNLLVTNFGKTK